MTNLELRNLLTYGLIAVLAAVLGLLGTLVSAGSIYGFQPGEPLATIAPQLAGIITTITAGLAIWLAANRPRLGSATLAAQVDEAKADGVAKQDLVVRRKPKKVADPTYPVLHRQCMKTAFVTLIPPTVGADLPASQCRHIDGQAMVAGAPMLCDTCHDRLGTVTVDANQWVVISTPLTLGGV